MSVAENTVQSYSVGLKRFSQFRILHNLPERWPPEVDHVIQFVAYLSISKLSHASVRLYLSAISFHCKALGSEDPTKEFLIQKMLEGIRRSRVGKDIRLPITQPLLTKIVAKLHSVCFSTYEALLFKAAFTLAFHGFMRVGEITASSLCLSRAVAVTDVNFDSSGKQLFVNLRFSKTDQTGKGVLLTIKSTNNDICAVQNMKNYLQVRPNTSGQLFCHFSGLPLTRSQFSVVLKKTLALIGEGYDRFNTHSFRIGAATAAAAAGLSLDIIRRAGRWKSDAVKLYIRPQHVVNAPL